MCSQADGDKATHVEDSVDPIRDLEIIREELRLKDVASLEKLIDPLKKEVGRDGKAKEKKDRLEIMLKIYEWIAVQKKGAQAASPPELSRRRRRLLRARACTSGRGAVRRVERKGD